MILIMYASMFKKDQVFYIKNFYVIKLHKKQQQYFKFNTVKV